MRCSVCHRPLTDPESIARGMGPVCAGGKAKKARSKTPKNDGCPLFEGLGEGQGAEADSPEGETDDEI